MIGWLRYKVARVRIRLNRETRICEFPDCYRVFVPALYDVPYYCPEHDEE